MKPLLLATSVALGLAVCACSSHSGATAHSGSTVTVTASPSAVATRSPASSPPNPPTATATAAAGCLSRYLHGSTGLSQGTAGAVEIVIVFKNLDNVPCTMYGYPGVAQAAGTPVTNIGQPSTENPATKRILITLPPYGYASATLQITDAGNYPSATCQPAHATWLAVIPPNQTVPLYVPYSSQACKSMSVRLLSVTTVSAGNGGGPG